MSVLSVLAFKLCDLWLVMCIGTWRVFRINLGLLLGVLGDGQNHEDPMEWLMCTVTAMNHGRTHTHLHLLN